MRILFVSNLYPPLYDGGYELACRGVAEALEARGHEVSVLTSWRGLSGPQSQARVHRLLFPWGWFYPTRRNPLPNLFALWAERPAVSRILAEVNPDVVYLWNMGNILITAALTVQQAKIRTLYHISDEWLRQGKPWTGTWVPWQRLFLRHRQGYDLLDLDEGIFASEYLRQALAACGRSFRHSAIVYHGVDVARFSPPVDHSGSDQIRLLYIGRLCEEKGLHVLIEALAHLRDRNRGSAFHLTVVGGGSMAYRNRIDGLVTEKQLNTRVTFLGPVSAEQVPGHYRRHDVFVLPAIWNEPFSISLLEAMASGLAVIGTPTGGTPEILVHGVNALMVPPGDPAAIGDAVDRLARDRHLLLKLRQAARETVRQRFTFQQTVEGIEALLTGAATVHAGDRGKKGRHSLVGPDGPVVRASSL